MKKKQKQLEMRNKLGEKGVQFSKRFHLHHFILLLLILQMKN